MRVYKSFLVALSCSILFLGGCGGGASNSSGTLTLSATAPADSTQPGTAVARYTAASGQNPIGVKISFSTDSTIVALDSTERSVGTDGTATVTYRALPVPTDTIVKITASTGGLSQFQLVTIKATTGAAPVTPPSVSNTPNSISFVSAQPANITLKGMGGAGLTESSIVSFIVKDAANTPLPNVTANFTLNTTLGGLTVTPATAVSDASGLIRTIVNSGTVATPVRVTATVPGTNISVQSDQLVVSTGVPAQDGMSVSFSNLNSESFNIDGVTVAVTVRLSDHFHNPVPDGTAVSLTTSGGSIQPSCTTTGGACTVNWTSQNPRPSNGRPVILAYAIGEESFLDSNGNGVADAGACVPIASSPGVPGVGQAQQCGEFIDTPEAFRDDNRNGIRDGLETFIDFNGDGAYNGPDSLYNGLLRPSSVASTVSKSKHVFYNSQIVMSTSEAAITAPASIAAPGNFSATITDLNGNTMASGTTITIATTVGTISGQTSYTVPQNTGHGVTLNFAIAAASSPAVAKAGSVTITVTSPGGLTTTDVIPIAGLF